VREAVCDEDYFLDNKNMKKEKDKKVLSGQAR
jgi:hypothetical protein